MPQIAHATGSGSFPLQSDRAPRAEPCQSTSFARCHLRGLGNRWRHASHPELLVAISRTGDRLDLNQRARWTRRLTPTSSAPPGSTSIMLRYWRYFGIGSRSSEQGNIASMSRWKSRVRVASLRQNFRLLAQSNEIQGSGMTISGQCAH